MTPDAAMSATNIWLVIFIISSVVFFGIAIWVIFRGGKDVIEILKTSGANTLKDAGPTTPS